MISGGMERNHWYEWANGQCLYYRETSQLSCSANQLTGFYMMKTMVVDGLCFSC